ncbi:MAG: hypothetical protein JETT_3596 [Candidatus Jettenia ecosi]|uniref:Uncharacterized protein n=1 Tax=Candidatus Jettenia ecosi TaxID=2494326 RepID=A0A533Q6G9_9BACT|nr:MAG: hypothetical protein JETT_3596 [Candidatus Jettenia ecosi]
MEMIWRTIARNKSEVESKIALPVIPERLYRGSSRRKKAAKEPGFLPPLPQKPLT